jgi:uracil-DNA glycosylase family 4
MPPQAPTLVAGFGPADAKYVIVGEALGATEVETRRAFTGPSGDELDKALAPSRIDRESDAFVTNTMLCRPPLRSGKDTSPNDPQIRACKQRLLHEIRTHHPDAVLAVGAPAAQTVLDTKKGIRLLRAEGCMQSPFFDSPVKATFHRKAREPNRLAVMISDIGKLVACGSSRS